MRPGPPLQAPRETESLTLALIVAVAVHALVITQVHFDWFDRVDDPIVSSLDVILVDWAAEQAPDKADFLAQANQVGGGPNDEVERPESPPPAPPPGAVEPTTREAPAPQPEPATEPAASELVARSAEAALTRTEFREQPGESLPNSAELLAQAASALQSAPDRLLAETALPKRPRRKFVTANTREHLYASYMRNWVAKVERVGNMNYPEAARQRNLEGSLVLSVDVLADGSIEHVRVMRSSGYELLDEAAVRIVRLAAPYAELPPDIRKETDILTITRTWQFSARGGLQ